MRLFRLVILCILFFPSILIHAQDALEIKSLTSQQYHPESIEKTGEDRYFITFEKAYFGQLELILHSETDQQVVVKLGEKILPPASVDVNPPGTVRYLIDTLSITPNQSHYQIHIPDFEPPGWAKGLGNEVNLPPEIGNVLPFRYVEIEGFSGTITKDQIIQTGIFYPFDEDASHFESSSEILNQVWELSKHTIKATSFAGVYVDGGRERRPYEGDAYINQLSHYAVDAEYGLARTTIDYLFRKPTWPTEWPLHMPMMLWEDYMYTGDKSYLEKYYHSLVDILENQTTLYRGLIANDKENDIIDWPASERDEYEIGKINNVPNAFYIHAWNLMAEIAGAIDMKQDSVSNREMAEVAKFAFQETFWDEETGLFRDSEGSDHHSVHANVFPIVFGIATTDQIEKVTPFIKSKGMTGSVYFAQYLLDALYAIYEDQHALSLITATDNRSWFHMIESGGTMTWEAWNEEVKPNLDWNHAWGAAPANIIARRLAGILPSEPGFEEAIIQPQVGNLTHFSVTQPTIKGAITLEMETINDLPVFTIESPVPIRFVLPSSFLKKKLLVNGQTASALMNVLLELEAGKHQITIQNQE